MRVVLVHPGADGGRLELAEVPAPPAAPGQVVIAVRAASVNRADLLMRRGSYAARRGAGPVIGGLDCAGEVLEVGHGVTGLAPGDRVMSMAGGSYADRVAVDARRPLPLPSSWSFAEGAAAITGLMTEHDALATTAGLRPGESVLVTGAASGVGLQAVALARRLGAGAVIALVRRERPAALSLLRELGAGEVLVMGEGGSFADAARVASGERGGIDVVIDHVGGPVLAETLRAVVPYARIVNIGRLGGGIGELDLDLLALRRARVIGSTFRIRDEAEIGSVVAALRRDLGDALAAGELRVPIDRTFALEDAEAAHRHMAEDAHLGKIVFELGDY